MFTQPLEVENMQIPAVTRADIIPLEERSNRVVESVLAIEER